jgi:hypothetical protein
MSTSKRATTSKRQRSSINPDTAYLQFLNNPDLAKVFVRFSSQDVHQERFIKFQDFIHYPLEYLFKTTGLFDLLSIDNLVLCYPFLVRLFYTNLSSSTPPQNNFLESSVKNIHIKLTPKQIGNLLKVPSTGLSLNSITMDDDDILSTMLEDGETLNPHIFNRALRPLPRLIGRILSHNILQKSGSFTYISLDLAKYIYAIMGGLQVNWARVIYDNLIKSTSSSLDHGCILTHIFKAFGVQIDTESDVLSDVIPFDRAVLKRMNIPFNPNEIDSDENEEHESPPHEQPPPSSGEAPFDYSGLVTNVENLSLNQTRMMGTQDRLVASHYVMQYQISHMRESQDELLRRFNE